MDIVKHLYNYTDYRKFMKDYFSEMKKLKEFFSFRYFASKAGFKSPNFCYYVINGTRNLSTKSLPKIISGMGLEGSDADYFALLVEYNQASTIEEKDVLFHKLNELRQSREMKILGLQHRSYTRHWYFPVIRELAVYGNWGENFAKLANMVHPPIKESEARQAVANLVEMRMIEKKDNRYVQCDTHVSIDDIPVSDKKQIRQEMLLRGYESVDAFTADERYIAYATLTLTKKEYEAVTEFLDNMRQKIGADVEHSDPEAVYQLMLQLFPVGHIQ